MVISPRRTSNVPPVCSTTEVDPPEVAIIVRASKEAVPPLMLKVDVAPVPFPKRFQLSPLPTSVVSPWRSWPAERV
jgi:hypothetical protein